MNETTTPAFTQIMEGDVLISTWGYDQTNVNFYMVTRRTAKQVTLQRLGNAVVRQEHFLAESVVPNFEPYSIYALDPETGERVLAVMGPIRRAVKTYRDEEYVNVSDHSSARLWKGNSVLQTHTH